VSASRERKPRATSETASVRDAVGSRLRGLHRVSRFPASELDHGEVDVRADHVVRVLAIGGVLGHRVQISGRRVVLVQGQIDEGHLLVDGGSADPRLGQVATVRQVPRAPRQSPRISLM